MMSCRATTNRAGRFYSLGGFGMTLPEVECFHWEQAHKHFNLSMPRDSKQKGVKCHLNTESKKIATIYFILYFSISYFVLNCKKYKSDIGQFQHFDLCVHWVFYSDFMGDLHFFYICKKYYPSIIHPSFFQSQLPPAVSQPLISSEKHKCVKFCDAHCLGSHPGLTF